MFSEQFADEVSRSTDCRQTQFDIVVSYTHKSMSAAGNPPSIAKGLIKSSLGSGCSWYSSFVWRFVLSTHDCCCVDFENKSAAWKPIVPLERDG